MSMADIRIYRDLPIINGMVVIPPCNPGDRVPLSAVDNDMTSGVTFGNSEVKQLTGGSGNQTGSKFGAQQFLRLEGIRPDEWYATDPLIT